MSNKNISKLFNLVKDYRADENKGVVMVSKDRIQKWVDQFNEHDRDLVLNETAHVFEKRYLSKENVKKVLLGAIKAMAKSDNDSGNIQSFLSNSIFLDLQPKGKSQSVLLELLQSLVEETLETQIQTSSLEEINNHQVEHFIYFDDVLCTGNTFFQDIKKIFISKENGRKEYYLKLLDGNIHFHNCFIFYHMFNGDKKRNQFNKKINSEIGFHKNFRFYYKYLINNILEEKSNFQILKPLEDHQNDLVNNYKNRVNEQVDNYINNKYSSDEAFYRPQNIPNNEEFFSSQENRIRYENILLKKGIEILKSSNPTKHNIRPLGYSLPSIRDFGFGTLCFTWRNVPNNTPLVFWYSKGDFMPLFPKKVSGQTIRIMIGGKEETIRIDR